MSKMTPTLHLLLKMFYNYVQSVNESKSKNINIDFCRSKYEYSREVKKLRIIVSSFMKQTLGLRHILAEEGTYYKCQHQSALCHPGVG